MFTLILVSIFLSITLSTFQKISIHSFKFVMLFQQHNIHKYIMYIYVSVCRRLIEKTGSKDPSGLYVNHMRVFCIFKTYSEKPAQQCEGMQVLSNKWLIVTFKF